MDCTHCKYPETSVVKTIQQDDNMIRRRRECVKCGQRFTTIERTSDPRHTTDDRFPNAKAMNGERYR